MTEKDFLAIKLEENGWDERLGGYTKPNYIHKITNLEGYGVFLSLGEHYLTIYFIYWKKLESKEYETKLIKYTDLPAKDYVQFINGTADFIFKKGLNYFGLEKIKDDFE